MTRIQYFILSQIALLPGSLLQAQLTYLDATTGTDGNTTLADGSPFTPPANLVTGADDRWEERTPFASDGNIIESGGEAVEDAPELRTRISGLVAGGVYQLNIHFWDAGPAWIVRAGFESNESSNSVYANPAEAAVFGGLEAVLAGELEYEFAPTVFVEADRTMYAGDLGFAVADTNGVIDVYVDDLPPSVAANERTWYDGLSYEVAPDSDGDGYSDLMEYALGLDPTESNTFSALSLGMGEGSVTLSLSRAAMRMDVNYRLQSSTDLISWDAKELSPSVDDKSNLHFEIPSNSEPKSFFRITFERP
jgi:hypothetical protein